MGTVEGRRASHGKHCAGGARRAAAGAGDRPRPRGGSHQLAPAAGTAGAGWDRVRLGRRRQTEGLSSWRGAQQRRQLRIWQSTCIPRHCAPYRCCRAGTTARRAVQARNALAEGDTAERITFTEVTPRAVQEALAAPRQISKPLVEAYMARRWGAASLARGGRTYARIRWCVLEVRGHQQAAYALVLAAPLPLCVSGALPPAPWLKVPL